MSPAAELYSHFEPKLRLVQHIAQVWAAAQFLLHSHSPQTRERRPETEAVLHTLVRSHDLGKGSPAFQQYIQNPAHYRDAPRKKAHASLSAALAILWAREQAWPPLRILALAQAIAGHHAGFATLDALKNVRLRLADADVLQSQWDALDRTTLSLITGLEVTALNDEFDTAGRWLFRRQRVAQQLEDLAIEDAVGFRIWTQFLFSVLLEADKAFLALREEQLDHYFRDSPFPLTPNLVDRHLVQVQHTPLTALRQQIRGQLLERLHTDARCTTLTLPTGVGKTLLAASWAIHSRQAMATVAGGIAPKIIVVLPYLSIIEQTEQEYRALLGLSAATRTQSERLMTNHSLSQREYELEGQALGRAYTEFFMDSWRSEIVLTTFDQLLLALFSDKTRHLMRFHHLLDAVIILDEVQTLPCTLWDLVDKALRALTVEGHSRVLLMSATQPALLRGAHEWVGDGPQVAAIFAQFRRYRLHFAYSPQTLETFIDALVARLDAWISTGQRVLITLNTRASARAVWQAVVEYCGEQIPVWLISADLTPRDRLRHIDAVRQGRACIVVSTQTVEAGVDIDMDVTLRDFAPLDAVVQIAGRCNRNQRLGEHGGQVEVVSLINARGRAYAEMIYDPVLLQATHSVLEGRAGIGEEDVLALSQRYFALLKQRMNTGEALTTAFARWQDMPSIHSVLRGERREQVAFLVLDDAEGEALGEALVAAYAMTDRWERRSALRRLAAALQQRTVTVYARPEWHPEDFAEAIGSFWVLREGWYCAEGGLNLRLDEDDPVCII